SLICSFLLFLCRLSRFRCENGLSEVGLCIWCSRGAGENAVAPGRKLNGIFVGVRRDFCNFNKDAQEWIIRESALKWVIARPAVLTNGPRTGTYRVLVDPQEWRSGFISRADVADFLVKQISDDALVGQTPVLIG